MKVCFPTQNNEGIESTVFNHFGSAPSFVIVNVATKEVTAINNKDLQHSHGACNPLKALSGESIDAIVVGGIGAGALNKLNQLGIAVYKSMAPTIAENITLFEKNSLPVLTMQQCCSGHSQAVNAPTKYSFWVKIKIMSPRHKKPRMCGCPFGTLKGHIFKPSGIPMSQLEHITIYRDELEVLSLCDFEDMTQEEAGRKMGVSSGTAHRLLMSGRKKLVEAVVTVKALIFEPETNVQN